MTLWIGLAIILAAEALLAIDLHLSGRGAIHNAADLAHIPPPATLLGRIARWDAVNMTAIAWLGYVVFLEGLLTLQDDSPARRRPHHFACLCFASVVIWCVFDAINFYFIHAWDYVGIPAPAVDKLPGYLLAFGAIVPGMLMSGQALLNFRLFDWARSPKWRLPAIACAPKHPENPHPDPPPEYQGRGKRGKGDRPARLPRWAAVLIAIVGAGMLLWPFLSRNPVSNYTLWTSFVFLLDPINLMLGRPSMLRDWQEGWYGRTLAAFCGGLICGLLWEFWNYWARAKWIYHLPFLGSLERYHYFEMPAVGLIGFIPFGIECWVMWQTMRIALDGLAEPLPNQRTLL